MSAEKFQVQIAGTERVGLLDPLVKGDYAVPPTVNASIRNVGCPTPTGTD